MPTKPLNNRHPGVKTDPHMEKLMQQFEKKISRIRILMEIGNALNSTLELEKLFELIVKYATGELKSSRGSLMILEGGFLTVKAARGMSKELMGRVRLPLGKFVSGWVAEHGQPLLIEDITRDKRFSSKKAKRRYTSNSCLSVPIIHKGEVLGVLNCNDKTGGGLFTEDDLEFMKMLATQAAVAIANTRLVDNIRELADHDGLTGLFNHRYFIDCLSREIERVDRYKNKSISLVMIDIDLFKNINDTYGHQAGNKVLKKLADKLVELTRKTDVICRYGGEEFMIILPAISSSKALIYTERIRETVKKMRVKINSKTVSIAVSAGIADYPAGCSDSKKLISCADQAMYQAKNAGRNCVRVHGADR